MGVGAHKTQFLLVHVPLHPRACAQKNGKIIVLPRLYCFNNRWKTKSNKFINGTALILHTFKLQIVVLVNICYKSRHCKHCVVTIVDISTDIKSFLYIYYNKQNNCNKRRKMVKMRLESMLAVS